MTSPRLTKIEISTQEINTKVDKVQSIDRSIVPRNQIARDSELSIDDLRFFPVRGRSYCDNDTQYNNIVDVYTFRKFPSSRIIFKEIQTFKRKPPTTL